METATETGLTSRPCVVVGTQLLSIDNKATFEKGLRLAKGESDRDARGYFKYNAFLIRLKTVSCCISKGVPHALITDSIVRKFLKRYLPGTTHFLCIYVDISVDICFNFSMPFIILSCRSF